MYKIKLTKSAKKDLAKIDKRYVKAIENRLRELKNNPLAGKPLRDDLEGRRSLREGVYRIIYRLDKGKLLILVVTISHRQSVYKK